MIDEHKAGLKDLYDFCSEPRSVTDAFPVLFKSKINSGNMVIAVGEALANLNHLVASKDLEVDTSNGGIAKCKQT